jgi:hypothetical protein
MMNWMFWKNEGQARKLPGPKAIPQAVGSYLVTSANMSPDLVWHLKAVTSPRSDDKNVIDVRVFAAHDAEGSGVKVIDYHSLDDHPALVVFDGWYNKDTHAVGKRGQNGRQK